MHPKIKRYWIEPELEVVQGKFQWVKHTLVVEIDCETWLDATDNDTSELDDIANDALALAPDVRRVRLVPLNKREPEYVPGVATGGSLWPRQ